jgi:hypothetical protein
MDNFPGPVGGGETHTVGPVTPTCVDRELFFSNEVFSITTSRFFSISFFESQKKRKCKNHH